MRTHDKVTFSLDGHTWTTCAREEFDRVFTEGKDCLVDLSDEDGFLIMKLSDIRKMSNQDHSYLDEEKPSHLFGIPVVWE